MNRYLVKATISIFVVFSLLCSCRTKEDPEIDSYDKVLVLHMNGFNNLTQYMFDGYENNGQHVLGDFEEIQKGWLPGKKDNNALLVVAHKTNSYRDYLTKSSPCLIRIYKDAKKKVVLDTIKVYDENAYLTNPNDVKLIYSDIKKLFKTDHYGLLFSSHGTGWLPEGYYSNPEKYESNHSGYDILNTAGYESHSLRQGITYNEEFWDREIMVKSFGQTVIKTSGVSNSYEMDIKSLVDCIPFHCDYVIFDACLMGGIEVAYQFRNKTDLLCFSQAEILAEGLVYTNIPDHLLNRNNPDVIQVAKDYYEYHNAMSGYDKSATISVIDCTKLNDLTDICSNLFEKYRDSIASLSYLKVQGYYTGVQRWYFDLEDLLQKSGISTQEAESLKKALNKCLQYSAATDNFLIGPNGESYGGFRIDHYSGISMYLPIKSSTYLNNYYKTLDWNRATELVK